MEIFQRLPPEAVKIFLVLFLSFLIGIAASSNNLLKGVYAYSLADKRTGLEGLSLLIGLAMAGLAPLLFLAR